MQKRSSTGRRLDVVQNARRVVEISIAEPNPPVVALPSKSVISQVMAEMGRKGGKIGGKRRLETLTPEERSQIASDAARKRWSKPKTKSKRRAS
jgi:hypothetical protein